jgi:Putative Actinobacterial Holin-X, holin superfamily III
MDNIKDTIFKFLRLDNLMEHLSGYVETKVALAKLEIREEVAHVVARGIISLIVLLFGLLFLVFLSLALARYLNTLFANEFAGYLIVGGAFGLIFLILLTFRKSILHSLEKKLKEVIGKKEH